MYTSKAILATLSLAVLIVTATSQGRGRDRNDVGNGGNGRGAGNGRGTGRGRGAGNGPISTFGDFPLDFDADMLGVIMRIMREAGDLIDRDTLAFIVRAIRERGDGMLDRDMLERVISNIRDAAGNIDREAIAAIIDDVRRGTGEAMDRLIRVVLPNSEKYTWGRDVAENVTVEETAFGVQNKSVILYVSRDAELDVYGVSKSAMLYDYTSGEGIVAMRLLERRSPCVILTLNETRPFEEILGELEARNGTTNVVALDNQSYTATSGRLSPREVATMIRGSQGIRRFCMRASGFYLAEAVEGPLPAPTADEREVQAMTLTGELSLLTSASSAATGRGNRFGNRFGNGNGNRFGNGFGNGLGRRLFGGLF